ncbi:Protein CBG16547, partial [Caenorhabditis briggsae]
ALTFMTNIVLISHCISEDEVRMWRALKNNSLSSVEDVSQCIEILIEATVENTVLHGSRELSAWVFVRRSFPYLSIRISSIRNSGK